jgi:hypothetical protein
MMQRIEERYKELARTSEIRNDGPSGHRGEKNGSETDGGNQPMTNATSYPNLDNHNRQKHTRMGRTVRAEFTPRGPYERRMFWGHLKDLGIEDHLKTCGVTSKKNEFVLT